MRVSYGVREYIPKGLEEEIIRDIAEVVSNTADLLADRIKANIVEQDKVDTGLMLGSVDVIDGDSDLEKIAIVGASYAIYQEFGTVLMDNWNGPFVGPAVDETQPELTEAVRQVLSRQ
jgi:HK97 gp10 family phage protein